MKLVGWDVHCAHVFVGVIKIGYHVFMCSGHKNNIPKIFYNTLVYALSVVSVTLKKKSHDERNESVFHSS